MITQNNELTESLASFTQREIIHNEILKKAKSSPENDGAGWSRADGVYEDLYPKKEVTFDFENKPTGAIECLDNLTEIETLLYTQIMELINMRKKNSDKRPITCVDIGGMNGLSFLKLAGHLKDRILAGQVELIVTNLGLIPDQDSISAAMSESTEPHRDQLLSLFSENLVRFVQGDINDLTKMVQSENKRIDIVHEQDALMHGYVNDRDFRLLFDVLSLEACLIIKPLRLDNFQNNEHSDVPLAKERFSAHQDGLKYLINRGCHVTKTPYTSSRLIISLSKSPIESTLARISRPEN